MKKGFTLLEILLALAIFGFAVTTLVGFHARGYVNVARARMLTTATELARGKMVDVQLDIEQEMGKGAFPEERSDEGVFDRPFDDYRWKYEIRKVELQLPPAGEGQGQGELMNKYRQQMKEQISEQVREIQLIISWKEMGKDRELKLVTHIVKM